MHNNFDDIEDRLRDFQDFEFGVTNDIWDNIESDIMMDTSVSNLNNLEFAVTDDIWSGIESELGAGNRKPAIWWAPGIVAGLLLLALVGTQFTKFNQVDELAVNADVNHIDEKSLKSSQNTSVNQREHNQSESTQDAEQVENIENRTEESLVKETASNTALTPNVNSSFNEPIVNNNISLDVDNSTSNTGFIAPTTTGLIAVNGLSSTGSNVVSEILDEEVTNNTTESPASRQGNNRNVIISANQVENNSALKNAIEDKNESAESNLVENKDDSYLPFTLTKDKTNQEEIIIDELSEEEVVSILAAINEEEEQEEVTKSKWKLIALGGMGNFLPIKESFDVVKPLIEEPVVPGTKPQPFDDTKQNVAPTEDDKPVEEGDGINYVKYAVPVSFALNGEFAISNLVGIRSGLNYTKLLYYFEVYGSGNKVDLHYLSVPVIGVFTIKDGSKLSVSGTIGSRLEKMFDSRYLEVNGDDAYVNSKVAKVENSELILRCLRV